jgi:hypothetical protein
MAKSIKPAAGKAANKKAAKAAPKPAVLKAVAPAAITVKALTPKLIALQGAGSQPATVSFAFTNGVGQVTACLFRHGLQINMQASTGNDVQFSDVQQGDVISVTGVATGTTDITVSVPTTPTTPVHITTNVIMAGYLIN